jgi:dTDP-4-amino-4,6-dideoxygalactose transaminase
MRPELPADFIPFNRPALAGKELDYISRALQAGQISGNGDFTEKCQGLIEKELGVRRVLLTTSCTHALEMAALLLDIAPGDEFIVPSFTFVTTALAFVMRGGRPVFSDIRPDTLNLDESRLESLITPRTRAVVPVHYGGVGCEMEKITAIARDHNLSVVEDNAHGLFGRLRGRPLGSFGQLAALSFHETKNFSCGEGGALLINDPSLIERAEIIREKGTNRSQMFRGEVDKYTWLDLGSSYIPSDILAAFLLAQLEERAKIQAARQRAWDFYHRNLGSWAGEKGIRLPHIPPDREQAYHLFYLLLPSDEIRQEMILHLRRRGIHSVFHYLPLHLSPMGRKFGGIKAQCPVTEDVSGRLLRLPFYNDIREEELARVTEAIREFPI